MDIRSGILATAQSLGIDPLDLATAISYETAGTFDPTKRGPTTQWGQHRGLIQFGEPQARQHGVDWDDPIGSQLGPDGAVASYLRSSGVKPGMGLLDVYSAINAGAPGLYNRSDANNGGAPGTVRDKVEQQMAGHRRKAAELLGQDIADDTMRALGREPMRSGGAPMQPEQRRGLLSTQEAPQGGQQRGRGLLGFMDPDRRDMLAMALMGMSMHPNQGLMQALGARMERRRDDRQEAQEQAKAQEAQNRTRRFIDQQVQAGNLPEQFLQMAQVNPAGAYQEAVKVLTTPQQDNSTALMQNVDFIMQRNPGMSFDEALQAVRSGTTVNVNSGSEVGTIPPGYELLTDPETGGRRLVPIEGGPAQREIQGETEARRSAQESATETRRRESDVALSTIQNIRDMVQSRGVLDLPETGVVGNLLAQTGINQEAVDVRNQLASLQGLVGFERLQRMRDESPTGGALGAISERELELLSAQLGTLNQSSSPDALMQTLDRIERIYSGILEKARAYPNASQFGFDGGGTPQGGGSGRIRYDENGNRIQ